MYYNMRVCKLVTAKLLKDLLKGKDGGNLLGKDLFKGAQLVAQQQAARKTSGKKEPLNLANLSPAAREAVSVSDVTQQ
eukprot:gene15304-14456_t